MPKIGKARYWAGVLYPENMRDNWQEVIGDVLQYPYAYCIHDKDRDKNGELRKPHVHLILVFPNTTTYNYALSVMDLLSAEGKQAINTCEAIISIRNAYDYLIHDTETSKKQNKFLYDASERVTGNNFDIGSYEQLTLNRKLEIKQELANLIEKQKFYNFFDLNKYVMKNLSLEHYQVFSESQGYFNNLVLGQCRKLIWKIQGMSQELEKEIQKQLEMK